MSSRPSLQPDQPRTARKSGRKPNGSVSKPLPKTEGSCSNHVVAAGASSSNQVAKADTAPNPMIKVGPPATHQVRSVDLSDQIQAATAEVPDPNQMTRFYRFILFVRFRFAPVEIWLIALTMVYFLAFSVFFFVYLRYGHEYRSIRLALTILSVVLDIAIVVRAQNKTLRIVLAAVPTLALATLQAYSESELHDIAEQRVSLKFMDIYEHDLHEKERHIAEDVLIDPKGTITIGEHVHKGFQIKSKRLQILVSEMEASLLAQHPEMLRLVLSFPDDPAAKLRSYEKLKKANPLLEMPIEQVLQPLRNEVAYSDLADFFRRQIGPQYLQLSNALNHKAGSSEACQHILQIVDKLAQIEADHPLAGLLNHMGTMALTCGRRYQALGYFYLAVALDPMHLPAYESLAYILWLENKDERTALEVVENGLRVCANERGDLENSFQRTMESYESIRRNAPARSLLLRQSAEKLEKRMAKIRKSWDSFLDDMENRLRNDFAYLSALGRWNEQKARAYIAELYQSNPKLAAYQDTYGFVEMRFARNEDDLHEAGQFFTAAIENPTADKETVRLASAHKNELDRYKLELQVRDRPAQVR